MAQADFIDKDSMIIDDDIGQLNESRSDTSINTNIQESAESETSPSTSKKQNVSQIKILRFPIARVKQIMKMDPDCGLISADALFLVAKATELFLEFLAEETGKQMGKRKTVMKRDVDVVIETVPELCFLDGALE